jgi:antitoxin VapB
VSRIGDNMASEQMEKPPFDVKAWREKLDSYSDTDFPEIEKLPPLGPDEGHTFD